MTTISRQYSAVSAVVASGNSTSEAISFADYASGVLLMPDEWTDADIGFLVGSTVDNIVYPLMNALAAPITIDVETEVAYPLPEELFGALYFKFYSVDGSFTPVEQAGERSIVLMLKS